MCMPNTSSALKTSTTKNEHDASGGNTSILRRYTTLPSLLHLLHNQQITLLSPESWDDRNDAFFLDQYRKRMEAESVLALCFSMARETYHHWRVFTHGSEGVCIEFERKRLLAGIQTVDGLRGGNVEYKRIDALKSEKPPVDSLPFLKRLPYEDEKEFRLLYLERSRKVEAKSFSIDLKSIRRVTLSPWMPKALVAPLKTTICCIPGCSKLKVGTTGIRENEEWKKAAIQK